MPTEVDEMCRWVLITVARHAQIEITRGEIDIGVRVTAGTAIPKSVVSQSIQYLIDVNFLFEHSANFGEVYYLTKLGISFVVSDVNIELGEDNSEIDAAMLCAIRSICVGDDSEFCPLIRLLNLARDSLASTNIPVSVLKSYLDGLIVRRLVVKSDCGSEFALTRTGYEYIKGIKNHADLRTLTINYLKNNKNPQRNLELYLRMQGFSKEKTNAIIKKFTENGLIAIEYSGQYRLA